MKAVALLPLLWACASAPEAAAGGALRPADFVGAPGLRLELAPAEAPDDPPLHLLQDEDRWELRLGEGWDDAEPVATWTVAAGERLEVDGVLLLGRPLATPEPTTTWYGRFSSTLRSRVETGPLAGEWVLAEGIGPIVATVEGERRECVYYERGEQDTGG